MAQALAHSKQLINEVFKVLEFVFDDLDAIINFSTMAEEYFKYLQKVFECQWDADLKLKKKKCNFF